MVPNGLLQGVLHSTCMHQLRINTYEVNAVYDLLQCVNESECDPVQRGYKVNSDVSGVVPASCKYQLRKINDGTILARESMDKLDQFESEWQSFKQE